MLGHVWLGVSVPSVSSALASSLQSTKQLYFGQRWCWKSLPLKRLQGTSALDIWDNVTNLQRQLVYNLCKPDTNWRKEHNFGAKEFSVAFWVVRGPQVDGTLTPYALHQGGGCRDVGCRVHPTLYTRAVASASERHSRCLPSEKEPEEEDDEVEEKWEENNKRTRHKWRRRSTRVRGCKWRFTRMNKKSCAWTIVLRSIVTIAVPSASEGGSNSGPKSSHGNMMYRVPCPEI